MVRTKVFVGNLAFKTQENELAKEFEVAGRVARANIITRGSRSLGYGFVEMESEQEAEKAVELLNKKNIDGREINVEVARPREENPAKPAAGGSPAGDANAGAAAPGGQRRRRPFRPGARRNNFRRKEGEQSPASGAEGASPAGGSPAPRPKRERAPRPPKNDADRAPRTPSNSTLFVANLPFSVDDAGLSKIFEGLNIKTAHVVRKRNDRSKGFGFVEFATPEDQQKALAAMDKKQVDGRELIVKVALQENAQNASPAGEAAAN
jgi:RNA recognition motif-containing protein